MKKFLVERETKDEIRASEGIKASSLLTLNLLTGPWPVSSSYSLVRLARELMQRLCQTQDLRAITIEI